MAQLNANAPASTEETLRLFAAIGDGDDVRVEAALCDGASVDSLDSAGRTALMVAVCNHCNHITKLLLARGADVHQRHKATGATPALTAAGFGNVEVVKVLVELGAELNAAINDFGLTLVYYASAQGDAENVRLLCEHGADINVARAVFFRGGVGGQKTEKKIRLRNTTVFYERTIIMTIPVSMPFLLRI